MNRHVSWEGRWNGLRWLCLLLPPLLGSCRNERSSSPAEPLTAEQKDHRELLLQPKPGWLPEDAPRKLNIMLLLEKTMIRKGETCNYRLEMQNVGRESLSFKETAPSFTKDGSLCGSNGFKFYATPPGAKERLLPCKPKEAAEGRVSTAPATEAESGLELTLLPGEYLLTRRSGHTNRFRELQTKFLFETVGTYRLKAVYAPKNGLRAVSNTVTLRVVP